MKIKVCGLTISQQINTLIGLETDFLGFIFYEKSPRYVLNKLNLAEIKAINHSAKVGVFVNKDLHQLKEIVELANLQIIQLHGDETQDYIDELKSTLIDKKIIKAIRINNQTKEIEFPKNIDYLLFDTDSKAYGGTGKTFDWQILNQKEIGVPYFLSGGISLDNIENIKQLKQQPFALDINSKFEVEAGVKDLEKIKTFKQKIKNQL